MSSLAERRRRALRAAAANTCPRCGRSNALMRARRVDDSRICRWEKSGRCTEPDIEAKGGAGR